MKTDEFTPSRLESWVYWRNRNTQDIYSQPFNLLSEALGVDGMPTRADFLELDEECPICSDTLVVNHPNKGILYCLCYMLEWQNELVRRYENIRGSVQPATLATIQYPQVWKGRRELASLKRAVDDTGNFIGNPQANWLILDGLYGTGKTHMLRAVNTALWPVAVYIVAKDIEDMTHVYRKNDDMGELYNALRWAPVLLLDDIGAEYGGRLVQTMIERVVDSRYENWNEYPMMVTTNKRENEFIEGDYIMRAYSRWHDPAIAKWNSILTPSYRELSLRHR